MRSTANFVSEAEQRGAWYVAEAEGLFGRDELISNDDWDNEEEDTDDVSNVESCTTPTVDENDPDPFRYELETIERLLSAGDVHPNRTVYIIYLLVLWMHTQFHLPFRACNTFLIVVRLAFEAAGVIIDPPMFTTLPTLLSHLEAKPTFQICPVCPKCLEPHPSTTSVNTLCIKCEHPLFKLALESTDKIHTKNRQPFVQYPSKSLGEQIVELLAIPGMEDEMDKWREWARTEGEYHNIFDGDICKTIPGPDGLPFFRHDLKEMPDGELRLGVTVGADWLVLILVMDVHD